MSASGRGTQPSPQADRYIAAIAVAGRHRGDVPPERDGQDETIGEARRNIRGITAADGVLKAIGLAGCPAPPKRTVDSLSGHVPRIGDDAGVDMIDKAMTTADEAVADIPDGASIMIGGFGTAGMPNELIDALLARDVGDLTIINNNAGNGESGVAALIKAGRVRKIICSFPRQSDSHHFDRRFRAGEIELELVPQGNLAARIQAAGSGLGAIFTPTGFGTLLAEGKETRRIDDRDYVLEYPICADFALIKALRGDRWGNLVYRKTARNFGPIMAMAAAVTIAQVDEIAQLGDLDPETVVTPGIFVQRVVNIARGGNAVAAA